MADDVTTLRGLLGALIQQESSMNPNAVSDTGYVGLMQLHPAQVMESMREGVPSVFDVAKSQGKDVGSMSLVDSERLLRDPEVNMGVGMPYAIELMRKYNWDIPEALSAYNAGPARLDEVLARGGTFADLPKAEQRTYAADVAEEYKNLFGSDLEDFGVLVSKRPQARGLLGM